MKVGWLADAPGYIGGAELTQAEFRAKAPKDVEVIDCPPSGVVAGLDTYVIHNCSTYDHTALEAIGKAPVVKYVNDCWPFGDPHLRDHLLEKATLIFTSPLHVARFPHEIKTKDVREIPPALDLDRFRTQANGDRQGNVCIGRMAYGKGVDLLVDYGEPVDVYSTVPVATRGGVTYKGQILPEEVPDTLAHYKTFVFLPTALEPFGRAVVEAWAAGCELILNRNVGSRHYIESDQEALTNAGERFWDVVCGW